MTDSMAKNIENVDDWLFRSIKDYSSLHMYELQHPTACMHCLTPSTVMVATQQSNGQSELMELRLPGKLLAEDHKKDLCSDRDFKLESGGFHEKHITQLAANTDNSLVVCAEKASAAIAVWRLGNLDSDLLKKVHTIHPSETSSVCTGNRIAVSGEKCVYGPNLTDLNLADIHTGKNTHKFDSIGEAPSNPISNLSFIDQNTCIVTTRNGQLFKIDTRTNNAASELYSGRSDSQVWTSCCDDTSAYLLSSDGTVLEVDLKNPSVEKQSWGTALKSGTPDLIQIKKSPTAEKTISVSGLDHNIHVYDLKTSAPTLSPQFSHIGHWAEAEEDGAGEEDGENQRPSVLCHAWHPTLPRLLLSAAGDGSFHAWQYHEAERS